MLSLEKMSLYSQTSNNVLKIYKKWNYSANLTFAWATII